MSSETRKLSEQEPRVETGNVKFGDDWTGVFIRGDNAFNYATAVMEVLDPRHWQTELLDPITVSKLADLLTLLKDSNESEKPTVENELRERIRKLEKENKELAEVIRKNVFDVS